MTSPLTSAALAAALALIAATPVRAGTVVVHPIDPCYEAAIAYRHLFVMPHGATRYAWCPSWAAATFHVAGAVPIATTTVTTPAASIATSSSRASTSSSTTVTTTVVAPSIVVLDDDPTYVTTWGAYAVGYDVHVHGAYTGVASSTGVVSWRDGDRSYTGSAGAFHDPVTGTGGAGRTRTLVDETTGTYAVGQQGAIGNAVTGDYAYGERGAAYNGKSGAAAAGSHATFGNAATGHAVEVGRGAVYDPVTGETHTAAGIQGESGGVARVDDQWYVGRDGEVSQVSGDARSGERAARQQTDAAGTETSGDASAAAGPRGVSDAAPRTRSSSAGASSSDTSAVAARSDRAQAPQRRPSTPSASGAQPQGPFGGRNRTSAPPALGGLQGSGRPQVTRPQRRR